MANKLVILGYTGLVGAEILNQVVLKTNYQEVLLVGRSEPSVKSVRVKHLKTDFSKGFEFFDSEEVSTDDTFDVVLAIGTTIKKAGSKEKFKFIDYEVPLGLTQKIASTGQIGTIVLISSVGADPKSAFFYLQVKGNLEQELQQVSCKKLVILRPTLLLGNRKEFRFGEWLASKLSFLYSPFAGKYKPIASKHVANAAAKSLLDSQNQSKLQIVEADGIRKLAEKA